MVRGSETCWFRMRQALLKRIKQLQAEVDATHERSKTVTRTEDVKAAKVGGWGPLRIAPSTAAATWT